MFDAPSNFFGNLSRISGVLFEVCVQCYMCWSGDEAEALIFIVCPHIQGELFRNS